MEMLIYAKRKALFRALKALASKKPSKKDSSLSKSKNNLIRFILAISICLQASITVALDGYVKETVKATLRYYGEPGKGGEHSTPEAAF